MVVERMGGRLVNSSSPKSDLSAPGRCNAARVTASNGHKERQVGSEMRQFHTLSKCEGTGKNMTPRCLLCHPAWRGKKKKVKKATFSPKTSRGLPAPELRVAKTLSLSDSTLHPKAFSGFCQGQRCQREIRGCPSHRSQLLQVCGHPTISSAGDGAEAQG